MLMICRIFAAENCKVTVYAANQFLLRNHNLYEAIVPLRLRISKTMLRHIFTLGMAIIRLL